MYDETIALAALAFATRVSGHESTKQLDARQPVGDVSDARTRRVSQSSGHLVGQNPLYPTLRRRLLDLFYW